jgi:hypothetical protein
MIKDVDDEVDLFAIVGTGVEFCRGGQASSTRCHARRRGVRSHLYGGAASS